MMEQILQWLGAALFFIISVFTSWKLGQANGKLRQTLEQVEQGQKELTNAIDEINSVKSDLDKLCDRFE